MDDQNSTEKSVGFFSLSVILHALVVFGILAGAAYRATQTSDGSKGDSETVTMEMVDSGVTVGDVAATPTEEVAAPVEVKSEEKPVVVEKPVEKPVVVAKPAVEVEKSAVTQPVVATKPAATKPVEKTKTVAKKSPAPTTKPTPKAIPTETQESEDAPEVAVAAEAPADEEVAQEETTEEPVAAVETQKPTQTKSTEEDIDKEEHQLPAVAAVPARAAAEPTKEEPTAAATVTQGSGNGEGAAKGDGSGATPSDAKDFANLKQKPGNRPPKYPMNDRRLKREGQVELTYFVSKQGTVEEIKVVKSSGYATLDHEAMETIRRYKFVPGQEGWTNHPVTFSLQGDAQQVGGLRH